MTRLALLATTFVLRLLRATLEAAKRLLLRCFRPHIEEEADARAKYSAAARGELPPTATARHSRSRSATPAVTTGNLLTSPFVMLTGLSVMREAELTDAAAAPLVVRSPSSSVETVTIGLLASSVTSPPASPSSPSHSSSASMATSTSSSSAADAALDKREEPTDAITSPVLVGKGRRIKPFPPLDDDSNGSSSNGSVGTHSEAKHTRSLTSQQDLDQRRNSFSAMTADGRAQLRRRSHDFTDYASYTLPPPGSSAGFLHARSKNHVHMRMYGKADTVPLKRVTARQAEGAALVDVICPSARTIWRRGQPVSIEWKVLDAEVQNVQIELMEEGSSATTTITKSTANSGFFMYPKVPWGMQVGPTYFLRISSAADPSRYMTTVFFSIGSAP